MSEWKESGDFFNYYLVAKPKRYRIVSHPYTLDPYSGRPGGIQEAPQTIWEDDIKTASSNCPLCGRDTPHAHNLAELARLKEMVSFLENKLGLSSPPSATDREEPDRG